MVLGVLSCPHGILLICWAILFSNFAWQELVLSLLVQFESSNFVDSYLC